jgi:hypothetical protein
MKEKIEDDNSDQSGRFFYPRRNKAGNGFYIVRFLPAPEGEEDPFIFFRQHAFGDGQSVNYRALCYKTKNEDCPVCKEIEPLWKGSESERELAFRYFGKKRYAANILILKDEENPENNGKVKTWIFSSKIYDKISSAQWPPDETIRPKQVFDLLGPTGANFYIKVKTVAGYANYDDSIFGDPGPLFDGDTDKILAVLGEQEIPSLQALVSDDRYVPKERMLSEFRSAIGKQDAIADAVQDDPEDLLNVKEESSDSVNLNDIAGNDKSANDLFKELDDDIPF